MNVSNSPPGTEFRAPRIYTFADVAMKVAHDGPWYAVIAVVFLLSLRGTTTAQESMIGLALTMLARNRSPEGPADKAQLLRGLGTGITGAAIVLLVLAAAHYAIAWSSSSDVRPRPELVTADVRRETP